jgi:ketosteroid isomerase-like protein
MARRHACTDGGVRTRLAPRATTRGRTFDEAVFVRIPVVARAIGWVWSRLQPTSPIRRAVVKRVVTRGCDAANRRDLEVMLVLFDPEVELNIVNTPAGTLVPPDLIGVHHGHGGYLEVIATLDETIEDFRLDYEEVIDYGDQLLITCRQRGRGRLSGVPYDEHFFLVLRISGGHVVRQENFTQRSQALDAISSV